MRESSLRKTGDHIARFIAACGRRIWTDAQIHKAVSEMRTDWGVAKSIPNSHIIEYLISETDLCLVHLAFDKRPITRYWWGAPSPYEAVAAIDPNGYFSHHSALYLLGLTGHEPDTIYFNVEQKNRGGSSSALSQQAIDRAFSSPPRVSNDRTALDDRTVCRISGKNTGNFGVVSRRHSAHGTLRITGIPRTLLDITVRPIYSGGSYSILEAYRLAAGRFKVAELLRALDEVRHQYPYEHSIGFLMERSGAYPEHEVAQFLMRVSPLRFYLDYAIDGPEYSQKWKLHYPRSFDVEYISADT